MRVYLVTDGINSTYVYADTSTEALSIVSDRWHCNVDWLGVSDA